MTKSSSNKFAIQQGISSEYLGNILTKDVTTTESIFELVDNAVDAARDKLLRRRSTNKDKYGLPDCYDGYRIDLIFENDNILFKDNCSGISESTLKTRAFMVGAMSKHPYGIGGFGIGLKRALYGLGKKYSLHTDTGKFAAHMEFTLSDLQRVGSELSAVEVGSSGTTGTQIRISKLQPNVAHEVKAETWLSDIGLQLSRRYGIFVGKGFEISVNDVLISAFGPRLRGTKHVQKQSDVIAATKRVHAFIESGMHADYRLTYEKDYRASEIGKLTDQYGWYFVCNDRIVEIASRDRKFGWTAIWHQEYYGFVGWVHFVAEDAQDLPWDTKKTMIDPNSLVFRAVSDRLQAFADIYRGQNKLERPSKGKKGGVNASNVESEKTKSDGKADGQLGARTKGNEISTSTTSHNQHWETLLPKLKISIESAKLNALIHEAEKLDTTICYSASMLFRSILETSLFEHLKATRSLGKVRAMVFEERAKKNREYSEDQKKKFRPSFSDALDWLSTNDEYFPDDIRRDCVFSRNKLRKHVQELNGIVHEGDLTNSYKLKIMRDDSIPLLKFLLGAIN